MSLAIRKSPYRFVVEAILFLTYAAFGLSWIAITPLMPDLQAAYGITPAQLGWLNSVVALAKVITPLLTGLIAVRFGLRNTVLIGSAAIATSVLVPFAPNLPVFLAERFIFGVGGAMVVTLLGPLTMQWFPERERPMVTALNNVALNTGITVTLFATVPLAARFGWRETLMAYGLLSAVLFVAWAFLGREDKAATPKAGTVTPQAATYREVWRQKETWLIALAFTGPLALYLSFNTWLPTYLMEAFGVTKAVASQYTGLFNLVGIPSALLSGAAMRYVGYRRPFLIVSGLAMGLSAFGLISSADPTILLVSAVVLGMSLFAYVSPLFTIPMELPGSSPQRVVLQMATVFSSAYAVSSLAPVLVGWLRLQTGSYWPGLAIWAAGSIVLAIAGYLLPETGVRPYKSEAVTAGPVVLAKS